MGLSQNKIIAIALSLFIFFGGLLAWSLYEYFSHKKASASGQTVRLTCLPGTRSRARDLEAQKESNAANEVIFAQVEEPVRKMYMPKQKKTLWGATGKTGGV
ncbi:hypothetical protein ACN47E_001334 [Coniothyrium glycines]